MYLNIGVMGLGSLISFDCTAQVWNNAADNVRIPWADNVKKLFR